MISIHRFKVLCRRVREAQGFEISNYAMEYNYSQFAKGIKTPLLERMETFFSCDLNSVKKEPFIPSEVNPRLPVTPKTSFTEDISHLILPIEKNRETKAKTNTYAYAIGMKFFIGTCSRHKETLYWAKSHVPVCCCCRYSEHQKEIQAAADHFLSSSQQTA